MKERMQQYQTKQEEDERTHKAELADKAARHLESFYQVCAGQMQQSAA